MTLGLRCWALPVACLAFTLFGSATARAFCRTNACDPARGETCTVDQDGCRQGSKLLYWDAAVVPFAVQSDGSPKNHIDAASFEKVIAAAFHTWSSVNCGFGLHPSISALSSGQVTSNLVEYVAGQSNANIFMFRDDTWMATIPGSALALTTVSYDWHTGQIYDADVEVNGTGGNITNGRPGDGADLPSIMTHEIGHFLGLDHSPKLTATMYITYKPGLGNLRALDPDDIAGMCAMYPPSKKSANGGGGPTTFVTAPLTGCSLASGRADQQQGFFWAGVLLGCVLGARRIRRVAPASRGE